MVCRSCGTEIAEKALICYRCGTPTTEAKFKPPVKSDRSRTPFVLIAIALLVALLLVLWGGLQ